MSVNSLFSDAGRYTRNCISVKDWNMLDNLNSKAQTASSSQVLGLDASKNFVFVDNNGGGTSGVNSVNASGSNIVISPNEGDVNISLANEITVSNINTTNFKLGEANFYGIIPAEASTWLYSSEINSWIPSSQSDAMPGNYTNANISIGMSGRITSISSGEAPVIYTVNSGDNINVVSNENENEFTVNLIDNIDVSGITTDTLNVNTFKNIFDTNPTENGQVLSSDLLGNLSWINQPSEAGTVNSGNNITVVPSGDDFTVNLNDSIDVSGLTVDNVLQVGSELGFTNSYPTNITAVLNSNSSGHNLVCQNLSTGNTASTNIYLTNDGTTTESSNYAVIGLNGHNYSGSNYITDGKDQLYISNTDKDIAMAVNFIGSGAGIHFSGNGGASAISIGPNNALSVNTTYNASTDTHTYNYGVSGEVLMSQGNAPPIWASVGSSTGTIEQITSDLNTLTITNGTGPIVNIDLPIITENAGSHTYATINVDQYGRIISCSSGIGPLTAVASGNNITANGDVPAGTAKFDLNTDISGLTSVATQQLILDGVDISGTPQTGYVIKATSPTSATWAPDSTGGDSVSSVEASGNNIIIPNTTGAVSVALNTNLTGLEQITSTTVSTNNLFINNLKYPIGIPTTNKEFITLNEGNTLNWQQLPVQSVNSGSNITVDNNTNPNNPIINLNTDISGINYIKVLSDNLMIVSFDATNTSPIESENIGVFNANYAGGSMITPAGFKSYDPDSYSTLSESQLQIVSGSNTTTINSGSITTNSVNINTIYGLTVSGLNINLAQQDPAVPINNQILLVDPNNTQQMILNSYIDLTPFQTVANWYLYDAINVYDMNSQVDAYMFRVGNKVSVSFDITQNNLTNNSRQIWNNTGYNGGALLLIIQTPPPQYMLQYNTETLYAYAQCDTTLNVLLSGQRDEAISFFDNFICQTFVSDYVITANIPQIENCIAFTIMPLPERNYASNPNVLIQKTFLNQAYINLCEIVSGGGGGTFFPCQKFSITYNIL